MNTRKTLGTVIIGVAITLAIAFLPLIIVGQEYITRNLITYTEDYVGNRSVSQYQLTGDSLFVSLLFIGLSIVTIIALKNSKKIYKLFFYPILIGVIIGIPLGIFFPAIDHSTQWDLGLKFNTTLFLVIFGIGVFISLISLGINLIKK